MKFLNQKKMNKLEELKQKVEELKQKDLSLIPPQDIAEFANTLFEITDNVLTELQNSTDE